MIKSKNKVTNLLHVIFSLNETSSGREINGLLLAMDFLKLKKETIITNGFIKLFFRGQNLVC